VGLGPGGAGRPGIASPWANVTCRSTQVDVRKLGASLVTEEGVLPADKTIRCDPKKSVLGFAPGDRLMLGTDALWYGHRTP